METGNCYDGAWLQDFGALFGFLLSLILAIILMYLYWSAWQNWTRVVTSDRCENFINKAYALNSTKMALLGRMH